jgi:lipoyl-dependent peroxiredoxin subunit D
MGGAIERLRGEIPEAAKDIKLNLQGVFQQTTLSGSQMWGVAVACAAASRNERLLNAVVQDAEGTVEGPVLEDALAAAALMAMNNVYYRFRHMVGKESYSQKPARLRMNRIAKPAGSRVDFELFCLAVSAINGCEMCIRSHEKVVIDGGLTEDQVHDAVRIAATIQAAAVALEIPAPVAARSRAPGMVAPGTDTPGPGSACFL